MNAAISRRFEKLDRQKRTVVENVEQLTPAQQQFRPAATKWSALNVVDHIVRVEAGFLREVREQLREAVPVSFSDRTRSLLVNAVMLSPLRVKVPANTPAVLPETSPEFARIDAAWRRVREELADLLHRLEPRQLSVGLFRHPVGGWMPMHTGLSFLSAHLQHHVYQLRRLRAASPRE